MSNQETNVSNGFESTLSAGLTAGAVTLQVVSTSGVPAVPFYVVVDPDNDAKREVVLVDDSTTGTTMVLSAASKRGQDGTTDVAHDAGAVVAIVPVAAHWTDINDRVDAAETDIATNTTDIGTNTSDISSHTGASTSVHGITDTSDLAKLSGAAFTGTVTVQAPSGTTDAATKQYVDDNAGESDHGALTGLADDDHTQYQMHDQVVFTQSGELAVTTGAFRWYPPYAVTLVDVRCSVGTAPTGSAITVDVNRNGATVFGTKPTISASSNVGSAATPTTTAVSTAQYVTVDIDAVGSTIKGSDLMVVIRYKRS